MNAQPINYAAVRLDLMAHRDQLMVVVNALNTAISGLENVIVSGIGKEMAEQSIPIKQLAEPPSTNRYSKLTILDAAKQHIRSAGTAQTVREITLALQRGGYEFNSEKPENTVNAVLHRAAEKQKGVEKVAPATFDVT